MHYTCWPKWGNMGLHICCECNDFSYTAENWNDAKRWYREHVAAVVEREANRWHQEPT